MNMNQHNRETCQDGLDCEHCYPGYAARQRDKPQPMGIPAMTGVAQTHKALVAQRELADLAMTIAMEASENFNGPGFLCYVNRATVIRIRTVLESAGVDWKAKHRKLRRK